MKTQKQLEKITKMMSEIAGQPVDVEDIKGTIYVFGTELATLRLLKKYRDCNKADCGYSENLQRFYFELEPSY